MRSRAGKSDALGAKVECGFTGGDIMRTVIVLVSAILPSVSLADSVRHLSVPERFWGTWGPEADLCRNDKAIFVVSAKGYVTSQANCTVQWVTETAGAGGSVFSAQCAALIQVRRMRSPR
jgi:hypothetical protein